jgi:hypothetical protein
LNFQDSQTSGAEPNATPVTPLEARLLAIMAAARYHGTELDRDELRPSRHPAFAGRAGGVGSRFRPLGACHAAALAPFDAHAVIRIGHSIAG